MTRPGGPFAAVTPPHPTDAAHPVQPGLDGITIGDRATPARTQEYPVPARVSSSLIHPRQVTSSSSMHPRCHHFGSWYEPHATARRDGVEVRGEPGGTEAVAPARA